MDTRAQTEAELICRTDDEVLNAIECGRKFQVTATQLSFGVYRLRDSDAKARNNVLQ